MGNDLQGRTPFASELDLRPDVATRVRIKDEWSDSWRTVDYLDALGGVAKVSPDIGQMRLLYRSGSIMNAGSVSYSTFSLQELEGKKVQVQTVSSPASGERTLWTGVITSESIQIFGDDNGATENQVIVAYEVGAILDRHTLKDCFIENVPGVSANKIGHMKTFNRRASFGLSVLGNMSSLKINDAHVFSSDGAVWTNLDIITYLLVAHPPPGIAFRITGQPEVLDTIIDVHTLEGMSLFKALDSLVDPHRGIGWRLISDGDGDVSFDVFTLIDEDISVGDVTVPANDDIIDNIAVDGDRGITPTITYTDDSQFDEVEVVGGLIRSCFSVSVEEETLEPAWTAAEENAYRLVAPVTNEEKDAERQTDKHLRVFQVFRIPQNWDGEADTGTPATHAVALPTVNDDGTISVEAAAERFLFEKALARALPIETAAAISGAEPEYQAPIVALPVDTFVVTNPISNISVDFVSTANGPGVGTLSVESISSVAWTPPGGVKGAPVTLGSEETATIFGDDIRKYVIVTRSSADGLTGSATVTISRRWVQSETVGANVKMMDSEVALKIEPSINHILARDSFDSEIEGSDVEPIYGFYGLNVTVALDTDENIKVRAKVGNFEDIEEPKTLTIQVPDAFLWYLTPGTMVGITDGAIVRDAVGGILRDDSDRLRQIAALALAWYGERRAILDISYARITNPGVLGSFVRSVSDSWNRRLSGTVITSLEWNFESGQQKTTINTSFADIQFEQIITAKDMEKVNNDVAEMARYLGNLPSRFKGGGGDGSTVVNDNRVIWQETDELLV
jgi:hypothetical protein